MPTIASIAGACTGGGASTAACIAGLVVPQRRFALMDDPVALDITALKRKSVSGHWELMFTRLICGTAGMTSRTACWAGRGTSLTRASCARC